MPTIENSRCHDCYDHFELKTDEKLFKCEGCKMKGFGQSYTCNLCGDKLHKECRYPKTEINHECFPGSTFIFREKPFVISIEGSKRREHSKCCDFCGKEICGFSYHCKEDNLDLHPCCRKLNKELRINDTVLNLGSKVSSKCERCHKKTISGGDKKVPGLFYVSTCRKYNFHVYCMTEIVPEPCMKPGNSALEKVDSKQLTKTKRNGGSGTFKIIKSFIQIIVSVLLGDPTLLIANVVVELFTGGK